jgi:hypothetical protein
MLRISKKIILGMLLAVGNFNLHAMESSSVESSQEEDQEKDKITDWENIGGVRVPSLKALVDPRRPGALDLQAVLLRQDIFRANHMHTEMNKDISVHISNLTKTGPSAIKKIGLKNFHQSNYIRSVYLSDLHKILLRPFNNAMVKIFQSNKFIDFDNPNIYSIIEPTFESILNVILNQEVIKIQDPDEIYEKIFDKKTLVGAIKEIYKIKDERNQYINKINDILDSISRRNKSILYNGKKSDSSYKEKKDYLIMVHGLSLGIINSQQIILKLLAPYGLTQDDLDVFTGIKDTVLTTTITQDTSQSIDYSTNRSTSLRKSQSRDEKIGKIQVKRTYSHKTDNTQRVENIRDETYPTANTTATTTTMPTLTTTTTQMGATSEEEGKEEKKQGKEGK